MDATAIKEIAILAVRANNNQALAGTHIPGFLVGDKLVTTEHLLEGRRRYRGTFETAVLADFAAYLLENRKQASAGVQGYIEPGDRQAVAFLNLGTVESPGHGDWRAKLALVRTAGYEALCNLPKLTFSQRTLAEWCEDWSAFLKPGGDQTLTQAIAAIRNVTITAKQATTTRDDQFSAARTALEEIEAKAASNVLPPTLVFHVEPHPGFDGRDFVLRVNLGQDAAEKPRFTLRVISAEQIEEAIAEEFKAKLNKAVGDGIPFAIGKFTP